MTYSQHFISINKNKFEAFKSQKETKQRFFRVPDLIGIGHELDDGKERMLCFIPDNNQGYLRFYQEIKNPLKIFGIQHSENL